MFSIAIQFPRDQIAIRISVGLTILSVGWLATGPTSRCHGNDSEAAGFPAKVVALNEVKRLPTRIAFGSCANQDKPQPILDIIRQREPTLFIYLGDNIYGDTHDMTVLASKYQQLGQKPEFQRLRRALPVLAVWDDHDYGDDDAGRDYSMKESSRQIFCDFWHVPLDSPRRQRAGIYGVHEFHEQGRTLQIILLDTRWFRGPLKRNPDPLPAESEFKNSYRPDPNPQHTLLGDAQWKWLEQQLSRPADLRVIATSIQFAHEYNGWESWTNLPAEQARMVNLIRTTKANGVVFISGDVHWGEISSRPVPNGYNLIDVTASGLTEDWETIEPNRFRIGDAVPENHFGMLQIDWQSELPSITLQIINHRDEIRLRHVVPLSQLRF